MPTSAPQAKIEVANESLLSKYDVKITADDKNMKPNPVPVKQDQESFNKLTKIFSQKWLLCWGASIKYVRTEGEGGGGPKAYAVREVA